MTPYALCVSINVPIGGPNGGPIGGPVGGPVGVPVGVPVGNSPLCNNPLCNNHKACKKLVTPYDLCVPSILIWQSERRCIAPCSRNTL